MSEFWEDSFKKKQMMWGDTPSTSALLARDFLIEQKAMDVLIPGIGYGRNAIPFLEAGMNVTGIEISQTAIDLAKEKLELDMQIYHGSVSDMPFDDKLYDGIFCYAVIHLLDEVERKQFINNCYQQLKPDGHMIFVAISTKASSYGQGVQIGPQRFEQHGGVQIYFYDEDSMQKEFENYGLIKIQEIAEPVGKDSSNTTPFFIATCRKQ